MGVKPLVLLRGAMEVACVADLCGRLRVEPT
jgi:hypothetical protein